MEPNTSELYLKPDDRLRLVCVQPVNLTSVEKAIVWSKAEAHRWTSVNVADDQLRYQTIDASHPASPYTITQRSANDNGDSVRSELVKSHVWTADSGYYRCRLGVDGESSRILVTVIDSTSSSYHVSLVSSLPTAEGNKSCLHPRIKPIDPLWSNRVLSSH